MLVLGATWVAPLKGHYKKFCTQWMIDWLIMPHWLCIGFLRHWYRRWWLPWFCTVDNAIDVEFAWQAWNRTLVAEVKSQPLSHCAMSTQIDTWWICLEISRVAHYLFDITVSFLNHVRALCRIADQYCIWDVHKIAPLLLRSVLIPLVNALISSRLDCCNSLLTNAVLPKLQMVQNSCKTDKKIP